MITVSLQLTWPFASALALLFVGLTWLSFVDIRSFEISPIGTTLAGGAIVAIHLLDNQPILNHLLFAAACYGAVKLLAYANPSAIGQGDCTLFALVGFAAGPDQILLAAIAFAVSALITALIFLRLRQKPLARWRRHMFPAAPAGCIAILAALPNSWF